MKALKRNVINNGAAFRHTHRALRNSICKRRILTSASIKVISQSNLAPFKCFEVSKDDGLITVAILGNPCGTFEKKRHNLQMTRHSRAGRRPPSRLGRTSQMRSAVCKSWQRTFYGSRNHTTRWKSKFESEENIHIHSFRTINWMRNVDKESEGKVFRVQKNRKKIFRNASLLPPFHLDNSLPLMSAKIDIWKKKNCFEFDSLKK